MPLCLHRHRSTHAPSATTKKKRRQAQRPLRHANGLPPPPLGGSDGCSFRRCPHRQRDSSRTGMQVRSQVPHRHSTTRFSMTFSSPSGNDTLSRAAAGADPPSSPPPGAPTTRPPPAPPPAPPDDPPAPPPPLRSEDAPPAVPLLSLVTPAPAPPVPSRPTSASRLSRRPDPRRRGPPSPPSSPPPTRRSLLIFFFNSLNDPGGGPPPASAMAPHTAARSAKRRSCEITRDEHTSRPCHAAMGRKGHVLAERPHEDP
mmetsp:Transcript_15178/g.52741  ORF Transcript_15178/g.52741 Transcript_15178/m.52741 type:complete len:257 (+) Transcript_15178:314-1084(+)